MKSKTQKLACIGTSAPVAAFRLAPTAQAVDSDPQIAGIGLGAEQIIYYGKIALARHKVKAVREYAQRMTTLQRKKETMRIPDRYCFTIVVAALAFPSATMAQPRDEATLSHGATLSGFKETDDVDD